jgi:hypothetical protein
VGHAEQIGVKRNAYRLLMGKSEGKRPLERLGQWWMENIVDTLGN